MAFAMEHHVPGITFGPADGSAPPVTGLTLVVQPNSLDLIGPDPAVRNVYSWERIASVTPVGVWIDPSAGPLTVLRLQLDGRWFQLAGGAQYLTKNVVDTMAQLATALTPPPPFPPPPGVAMAGAGASPEPLAGAVPQGDVPGPVPGSVPEGTAGTGTEAAAAVAGAAALVGAAAATVAEGASGPGPEGTTGVGSESATPPSQGAVTGVGEAAVPIGAPGGGTVPPAGGPPAGAVVPPPGAAATLAPSPMAPSEPTAPGGMPGAGTGFVPGGLPGSPSPEPTLLAGRPQRKRSRVAVISIVTALVLLAIGGGIWLGIASNSSASSTATTSPPVTTTAPTTTLPRASSQGKSLLSASLNATSSAQSFHYTDSSTVTGPQATTQSQTGVATPTAGYQVNNFTQGVLQDFVNNGSVYVNGDAGTLQSELGLSQADATTYAGRWISLAPTDAPTKSVAAGMTVKEVAQEALGTQSGTLTPTAVSAAHVVGGVNVITVSGVVSGNQSVLGTAATLNFQLTVEAAAPHLPVALTETGHATLNGTSVSFTSSFTFSQWNAPVALPTPTAVIPYASIPSANTQPPSGSPSPPSGTSAS